MSYNKSSTTLNEPIEGLTSDPAHAASSAGVTKEPTSSAANARDSGRPGSVCGRSGLRPVPGGDALGVFVVFPDDEPSPAQLEDGDGTVVVLIASGRRQKRVQTHRNPGVPRAAVYEDVFQYELDAVGGKPISERTALFEARWVACGARPFAAGRNMVDQELSPGKRSCTSFEANFNIGAASPALRRATFRRTIARTIVLYMPYLTGSYR